MADSSQVPVSNLAKEIKRSSCLLTVSPPCGACTHFTSRMRATSSMWECGHTYLTVTNKVNVVSSMVAVHGLGGDPFSTWQHSPGNLWLRDLPTSNLLCAARIMTFGYDAAAFIKPFTSSSSGRSFTFAEALLNDLSDERTSTAVR